MRPFVFVGLVLALALCAVGAESVGCQPVSPLVIAARLERFDGNDQKRERTLKQLFSEAGCDAQHLSEQPVGGSRNPNVICVLPGSSDRIIIVGAHFDHAPQGDGVVDNWSGASLLPSLFEAIKAESHKHTYVFVGFTDEERGEVGSHFYAKQMTKAQVAETDAMVNMDTLGLASTEVWASHADKRLVAVFANVANEVALPWSPVNVDQVGSTDSEQFAARKIPAITIHSLTQEAWNARILHSSKDKLAVIRIDDYYETYKLVAAFISSLDQTAPSDLSGSH